MIQGYSGLLDRIDGSKSVVRPSMPLASAEKNKIVILAIDPTRLFAYFSFEKNASAKLKNRDIKGTLEVYSTQLERVLHTIFNVNDKRTMNYYLNGLKANTEYFLKFNVPGIGQLVSNKAKTPRKCPSDCNDFVLSRLDYSVN